MPNVMYGVPNLRCRIPTAEIEDSGPVAKFFKILPNSTGLTEEYLYAHQPVTDRTIPVYATNAKPIGYLDDTNELRQAFAVIRGPVIVVARKGYAGRLFVAEDKKLIIHEDAYAIEPKEQYLERIDLHWFAGHYSEEFQGNRTSFWGIGDFPRQRLRGMWVIIPSLRFQRRVANLYHRRDVIVRRLQNFRAQKEAELSERIGEWLRNTERAAVGDTAAE